MAFFEKPLTRKDVFSIPNIMGYFRILLIPIYVLLYYHAESVKEYYSCSCGEFPGSRICWTVRWQGILI